MCDPTEANQFDQRNVVETFLIAGSVWDSNNGVLHDDPTGKGGQHSLGMPSSFGSEDGLLGHLFGTQGKRHVTTFMGVSSIDVSSGCRGGPFGLGAAEFKLSLLDSPTEVSLSGTLLDFGNRVRPSCSQ